MKVRNVVARCCFLHDLSLKLLHNPEQFFEPSAVHLQMTEVDFRAHLQLVNPFRFPSELVLHLQELISDIHNFERLLLLVP